jgi:hypothetical protein
MMVTSLVARTRVRAHDEIRACHARDFPGLQLIHTVAKSKQTVKYCTKKITKIP